MTQQVRPAAAVVLVSASDTVDLPVVHAAPCWSARRGAARIMDGEGTDTGGSNLVPLQAGYNPIQVKRIFHRPNSGEYLGFVLMLSLGSVSGATSLGRSSEASSPAASRMWSCFPIQARLRS